MSSAVRLQRYAASGASPAPDGEWVRWDDVKSLLPSEDLARLNLIDDQDHVALLRDVAWALAMDGATDMGFRVRAAAAYLERMRAGVLEKVNQNG
jgi:hypothetical protein